ncbi:hypothetical protein G3O08_12900 [Cryomorpha ignava]|uniref:Uncharacterized protein n=1 Tax=Cryomorpha ignava TaxID=101383 RepID=A0A7K3WU35_9FLAO|nr:hypothetical protein [Cryomorpha ignava]NEN24402.1 hypothetical protein [Cryomorpha ignava]
MKTSIISILALSLIAISSCNNPTEREVKREEHREVEIYDDSDTLRDYEEVLNRRKDDNALNETLTDSVYASKLNADRSDLYNSIGMTTRDIEQFEENYNERLNTMKTHGLGNYTLQDLNNQEDESMKMALSDPQYRKYLQMKLNPAK